MRKYKPAFGKEVDLDNPKTYSYLPKDVKQLDDMMFREIGYALVYMNNFHPEIFPDKKQKPKMIKHPYNGINVDCNNCGYSQRLRVYKLIKQFADNRHKNYNNKMWIKEHIFLFQDETENMC